ncbi:MAG TPA: aspartate/glutamate racemase family protein [Candidatus Saccharimonadales bacterium]|nr:aspartate/glutamate racemase family protein [Candidatus Saccharimonadales bacterium]
MMIGVFDSGLGGQLVAERLGPLLPGYDFMVIDDRGHLPYGDKSADEIISLTEAAVQPLLGNCPIVVLACNTATAAAIDYLRRTYPKTQFVGFEPMVKPAAELTRSGQAVILATAATRNSVRYQRLIKTYGRRVKFIEPDTTDWAWLIEAGRSGNIDLSAVLDAARAGADVVALACTHYLALKDRLHQLLPAVAIIEPTAAVAAQIKRLVV